MKRTLLLSLCLGALSVAASATAVQFNTSTATITESGSGSSLNSASGTTDNAILNLNTALTNLFSTANTGGLANGLDALNLPSTTNYEFFKLGTLTLNESISSDETNNLGPLNISFGLTVGTGGNAASRTFSISTSSWTANASGDYTTLTFPGHPGQQLLFSNGAIVEAVIYAGSNINSGNSVTLDYPNTASRDIYVKLGLIQGPSSVPEPGSMALLGSGLVGLGLIARRRAQK